MTSNFATHDKSGTKNDIIRYEKHIRSRVLTARVGSVYCEKERQCFREEVDPIISFNAPGLEFEYGMH